jgi:hypothetical protein
MDTLHESTKRSEIGSVYPADETQQADKPKKLQDFFKNMNNNLSSLANLPENHDPFALTSQRQYSLRNCTLKMKSKIENPGNNQSDDEEVPLSESSYEIEKRKSSFRSKIAKKTKFLKGRNKGASKGYSRKSVASKLRCMPLESESEEETNSKNEGEPTFHESVLLNKLPHKLKDLTELQSDISLKLAKYKRIFFEEEQKHKTMKSEVPEFSIPISADVTTFNFDNLAKTQIKLTSQLFDVIMMDPPWQLSTSQPSRGVAIAYQSLNDDLISELPIQKLQTSGFLFIWVINAKYSITCKLMEKWGYTVVDEIAWIKKTVTGKIAKGHGFYLQHAKETCLVGVRVR